MKELRVIGGRWDGDTLSYSAKLGLHHYKGEPYLFQTAQRNGVTYYLLVSQDIRSTCDLKFYPKPHSTKD